MGGCVIDSAIVLRTFSNVHLSFPLSVCPSFHLSLSAGGGFRSRLRDGELPGDRVCSFWGSYDCIIDLRS